MLAKAGPLKLGTGKCLAPENSLSLPWLKVHYLLQAQAASQDRLEQMRASHHASLTNQLNQRIQDLECELDRIQNTQQDSESTQAEGERYKELYLEEVKIRRCLANKLER